MAVVRVPPKSQTEIKGRLKVSRTVSCGRHHRGFTLVELLVVIAIIGVMVGLLLPAVQSAREAARYTQCRNHLKQLSLGIHMHESQYKILPDGGLDWFSDRSKRDGIPEISPSQDWGWMYQILPFIEQGAIYDEQDDAVVREYPVEIYFCPSRRSSTLKDYLTTRRAVNDYAGNGGILTQMTSYWGDGKEGESWGVDNTRLARPWHRIRDGLSTTLMVGEKSVIGTSYRVTSCADNEGWTAGWDWDHDPLG